LGCVNFEAFIQEGFEFLHRCILSHVVSVSFTGFFWPRGCLRRSWGSLADPVFPKRKRAGWSDPARSLALCGMFTVTTAASLG
jgi:hypothetical protein